MTSDFQMKPTSFILPVVALILVGSWVGPQRRSMAAVETECVRLRTHIAAVRSASPATSTAHDPLATRRKVIEWTNLAAYFPSNPMMSGGALFGALPDVRVAMRFRQRIEAMSAGEIIATLDEIAALNLPADARANLERTLLDSLVRKDPGLALGQMEDRAVLESSLYSQLISDALQAWAKKDAGAAGAWFDQQIAAGKFKSTRLDGVSGFRRMFESSLIGTLLSSSPEAAARRLAALPDDQRGDVMSMYSLTIVPQENQVAHAELIRAHVPAKDQAETIAAQASRLFKPGDYSAVTAYLERIGATPAERAASALKAIQDMRPKIPDTNQLTREDIDDLREWVGSQAPDSTDLVTGKALGEAAQGNRKMNFSTAAELAVEYSAASGDDEILATFLTSWAAKSNKAAARILAGKISDETRRAEILNFLK